MNAIDTCKMPPELQRLLEVISPKVTELCQGFMAERGSTLSSTVTMVVENFQRQCGRVPVAALAEYIALAIQLNSFPQVRDDFSIPDLGLVPCGIAPTGVASNGQTATTFVTGFNVAPGQSILLQTQDYSLPYNPDRLWGMLAFNAGLDDANYRHVTMKAWVGPRNLPAAFALGTGGPLYEWQVKRFIYGSQFRCGDGCTEVALRSFTGCTAADIVGLNARLYIQVDNAATATNSITGQQQVVKLGGFIDACCGSCAVGKACTSGCKSH